MVQTREVGGRCWLRAHKLPALINYYQAVLLLEAAFDEVCQHFPNVSWLCWNSLLQIPSLRLNASD